MLDIILLVIIGLCLFEGLRRGLLRQLVELGGLIAAFILAAQFGVAFGKLLSGVLKLENYASTLNNPLLDVDSVANILYNVLGYVAVFLLVLIASRILAIVLNGVAKLPLIGTADKIGGIVAGLVKGALIALAANWGLDLLPIPFITDAVASSHVSQFFLGIAPGLYQQLRDLLGAGLLFA